MRFNSIASKVKPPFADTTQSFRCGYLSPALRSPATSRRGLRTHGVRWHARKHSSLSDTRPAGKRVQTAVIQHLLQAFDMASATNIILTGGSSGGLATYLTCDRVGEQVTRCHVRIVVWACVLATCFLIRVRSQIKAKNPTARYTCLADAGYFLHHDDINGQNKTSQASFGVMRTHSRSR